MDHSFWHQTWNKPQRGFHLDQVNPLLQRFLPPLSPDARILVPLCGKSLDLTWLENKGFMVEGVELSEVAAQEFWQERKVSPQASVEGAFNCTRSGHLRFWQGDLFDLETSQLGPVDLIYDRAALVAWPEEMRARYLRKLTDLAPEGTQWLLICLDYPQKEMSGPPFSITPRVLKELVAPYWQPVLLHTQDILPEEPHFQGRGLSYLLETVWLLTRKPQ